MEGPVLPSIRWLLSPKARDFLSSEILRLFETLQYLLGSKSPSGFRFKGILDRKSVRLGGW